MKAVKFAQYGGPEVLKVVETEEPHPAAGQVRIAVRAAGVNPIDWKIRSGVMAAGHPLETPAGVGMDAAGVVDEIGDGVDSVVPGDEVFGHAVSGAAAEFAVLSDWVEKPAGLSFEEAAGFPMPAETARRALNLLPARSGQTLIVNGAAGGVGLAAVQFALADGLMVIGTASERNHEFLRSLGAIPVSYGEGLVDRVNEIAPRGVDVAFDAVGSGTLPELIQITGSPDAVITIADADAARHGVRFTSGGEGRAPEGRADAAALFEQGKFTLPVAETFPLEDTQTAHAKSEEGHVLGKYILTVS
ncbi:NADP-dependent oxidoreductase [Saxibacter everestensis]|uniref:NADP-dependent oxidoreductase n=1 Tax=Saxibacter everestensis TaxID=2909229 RepID=A0ABY8QRX9_9MICO|nr:NADP-dependent oxidoreductase [Brevibacteriaceae bacterium ZFBP1038]